MGEDPTLDIGTRLGERYELTEEIGEGGFGKIFRGRQLNIDREVAVKVLPPKFSSVENVVQRFRREARLASRLRHPNTITIHDYGRQRDFFFIVMELLEGRDLADRLTDVGRLPLEQAVHIGRQTLRSLREAHNFGIIHRDLKPENIFLTDMDGDPDYVKVLDFGIAKLATHDPELFEASDPDENRSLTVQGNTVGTPCYMSPEQAAAEDVGAASDLYTVGLILYEMVNGHPPFDKESPAKTMRAQLLEDVPPFSNDELQNSRFESLVRKALAKEPEDRYADADEFLDALSDSRLDERALGAVDLLDQSDSGDEDPASASGGEAPPESDGEKQDEEDEIPFDNVPEQNGPPAGFDSRDNPAGSSIVTVLDEPTDDEDVIVLTNKKEDGDPPDQSRVSRQTTPPGARAASPAADDAARDGESTERPTDDGSGPVGETGDWEWGDDAATADATGSQVLTDYRPERRRGRFWAIAAVLAAIGVLVAVLFVTGVIALPV